jgi:5-methylcytosine-specific restriction endonuclease McrA
MDYSQYPTTRAEAKATGASHYFTGEPCKHGHVALRKTKGACVECLKVEWQESNAKRADYFKKYNQSETGKASKKKYYEANKDLIVLKALSRPNEQRRMYRKNWKVNNPSEVKASTNDRRRRHKNATPKWLTKEQKAQIRQMYVDALTTSRVTGVHYVVDHIVPIRGESVCGLHVPWNLRIITQEENLKKSNKLLDSPQTT